MKKLLSFLVCFGIVGVVLTQRARVQVVHNSADAAATQVDVYLDNTLLLMILSSERLRPL